MGKIEARAYGAGKKQAEVIIENVHLMYQNNTARNYYLGMMPVLVEELERRFIHEREWKKKKGSKDN